MRKPCWECDEAQRSVLFDVALSQIVEILKSSVNFIGKHVTKWSKLCGISFSNNLVESSIVLTSVYTVDLVTWQIIC